MKHRISRDDEAVSPVIAVILMVAITVVLAAVLYVWAASFLQDDEAAPIATFYQETSSDGTFHIRVVKVSDNKDLEAFKYFLKDDNGNTQTYGEIAIQNISSTVQGIESEDSWDIKFPGEDASDLGKRAYDVENEANTCDQDDTTNSKFPVVFYDNDRDGKLSSGDQFIIRGEDYGDYDATDDWRFEVQYDLTGDIIGSKDLG